MKRRFAHLSHRFFGALSRKQPTPNDLASVATILTSAEFDLWGSMVSMDQRHSIDVMRRFVRIKPDSPVAERRAALLHDVGKTASNLGVVARVVATVVGPHGAKFRSYHDHQRLGAALLREIASDPLTVRLVEGTINDITIDATEAQTLQALRHADDLEN